LLWFSFDKVEIGDIHISDSYIFNRYIWLTFIQTLTIFILHVQVVDENDNNKCIVSHETNFFLGG